MISFRFALIITNTFKLFTIIYWWNKFSFYCCHCIENSFIFLQATNSINHTVFFSEIIMSYIRSVLWDVIFTQKTYFRILCETIASDSQQHLENMFSLYYFIIIYLRFLYFQILRRKIASFRDAHKSFVDLIYYMFSDSQNLDILLLEYHPKNSIYWRMQYLGFMYLFWMQIVFCFFLFKLLFYSM